MPKWICPVCAASYTVGVQHVGKSAKCQKCGVSNVVTDSSAVPSDDDESRSVPSPVRQSGHSSAGSAHADFLPGIPPGLYSKLIDPDDESNIEQLDANAKDPQQGSTTSVAKAVLVVMLVILFASMMLTLSSDKDTHLAYRMLSVGSFVGLLVQMALVWPFYTACDDIHAIRQIAEKYR